MVSSKKINLFLISSLVFFGLFLFAQPAHAIFGVGDVGLFDLGMMQLDALDFVDNVIMRAVVFIFALMAESQAFVVIAAALLQWAVGLPVNLHNSLVTSGWTFISGLTNLFFILVFIGIALAFILKTETFGMKKALPNLIIIALLINFSLVFVGMVVDIGDISRNALLTSLGNNFVTLAIGPLQQSAGSFILWATASLTIVLVGAFIPYYNSWVLAAVASLFISDIAAGGVVLRGIMLIILNFVTGGIFFLYFGLFLVRIVIIWMLAIFAPLALFAYILPATKKYFSQWLHYLLSWAFMGIVAVFLIGLGLGLFAKTGGEGLLSFGTENINTVRGAVPPMIYHYLFLIIYLMVAFFVCKKYVPAGADMIMKQGEALIGKAWGGLKKTRTMGEVAENIAGAEKWGEKAEKEAQKLEQQGKTGRATFMRWAGRAGRGVSFATKPIRPALINYAAGVRKTPLPANWKQMTIDDKVASINASRRDEDKIVKTHAMGEEGTLQKAPQLWDLAKRLEEKFKNDPHFLRERSDIADVLTNKVITADVKVNLEVGQKSQDEMRDKINNWASTLSNEIEMKPVIEEEAERLAKEKLGRDWDKLTDPEKAIEKVKYEDPAAKNVAARYIHYTELKSGDMKNQAKASVESAVAGRALRDMTPQHLQAIQSNFKTETIHKVINNTFGKMFEGKMDKECRDTLDKYLTGEGDPALASKHARLINWAAATPAGREFNLPLKNYMSDLTDEPTDNLATYTNKGRILGILNAAKRPVPLTNLFEDLKSTIKLQREIVEAAKQKQTTVVQDKNKILAGLETTIKNKEGALVDPVLKSKWNEIKEIAKEKGKRK